MVLFLKILIFVLLGLSLFLIFIWGSLKTKTVFKKALNKISQKEEDLKAKSDLIRQKQGLTEKTTLFEKLSSLLARANAPSKITPIRYLFLTVSVAFVFFVAFSIIFNLFIGIFAFAILMLLPLLVLLAFASINYSKVDKSMVSFLSLLSNFANETTDIITLLSLVLPYTEEPIYSPLKDALVKARTTTDIHEALTELAEKVGHEKFTEVLTQLEVASKNNANYRAVISEMSNEILSFIKYNDKKKRILASNRLQAVILIGCFIASLYFTGNIANTNIITILTSSPVGYFFIGYIIVTMFALVFTLVAPEKKE